MLVLTETYKKRLSELAGIPNKELIMELTDDDRRAAYANSGQRIPYNKDLMVQAIKEGREVGLLFQSKNDKYKMPIAKYRTIFPVALGTSKAGNEVLRAVHKIGQSESEARRTGVRSAEVEDEWRMFKTSNIKSMFFTGRFFSMKPAHYKAADKGMVNVEVAANFNSIKQFQRDLVKNAQQNTKPKPNIVSLFKNQEPEVETTPTNVEIEPETVPNVTKPVSIKNQPVINTKNKEKNKAAAKNYMANLRDARKREAEAKQQNR